MPIDKFEALLVELDPLEKFAPLNPAAYTFPDTPTPPYTCNAPVNLEVEAVLELTKTPPPLPTLNPHFVGLPVPLKVGSISSPTNSSELDPEVKVGETTKPRAKDALAVTLGENVLRPVNVWVPVETKPGLVALAAERVKVVPLIVPPVE